MLITILFHSDSIGFLEGAKSIYKRTALRARVQWAPEAPIVIVIQL